MKPSRIAGAFALVLLAGAARAESSIPEDAVPLVSDLLILPVDASASDGAPAGDAVAAVATERAQEKAAIDEYNCQRDLEAVWAPTP